MSWFKNLKVRNKLLISFMLIIILAASTGVYIIINVKLLSDSYSEEMDVTGQRISHIFAAKDIFARARVITSEIYSPDITREKLVVLSSELSENLKSLTEELKLLSDVAAPAVQEKVKTIIPLVEDYKNDSMYAIGLLLSADEVSFENPEYRVQMIEAELVTRDIEVSYADYMTATIRSLSGMAINVMNALSEENSTHATNVMIIAGGLFALVAAVSVAIAIWVPGLISKPLIPLATFMKKAGTTGNISLSPDDVETIMKYSLIKDEIGTAIDGAAGFVGHVSRVAEELESVSDGDLTTDISLLSDEDVMGISIKNMLRNLNNMFIEIQATTDQVSAASRQVAAGSQTLAQGSTEQAASIQELSSSIADIAQRTKENASTAEKTSQLSDKIMKSAQKGSQQMDEMINAVKEINEASQSISKIIKTIDDIAFQTNILALNAAVEAARAGQHGKGFAVVAEEVRNLAAKSAEAARETGDMIQNSMEKAEFGSAIASETAESLTEIVSGITESSRFITEIARASEDQTLGISQINIGIDQVAQVVQQNSATAEESAAASEEMSSHAAALEELLGLFKVRDNQMQGNTRSGLYRLEP